MVLGIFSLLTGVYLFVAPTKADALSGSSFNNARIIDDTIYFNKNTMNTGDIQNFLNSKVPSCDTNGTKPSGRSGYATRADWGRANGVAPPYTCLKDTQVTFSTKAADAYCGGISGGTKSAANVIYDVAQACGTNPQAIIVLLQKEQSLITDDWPWPIQYRSATGYGCPDTAPCDAEYYGFFNQVYNAARQTKRYIAQPQMFNFAAGRTSFVGYNPSSSCGGTNVAIQNGATAALYNYTPYQPNPAALANLYGTGDGCSAYGNRNFWRMFNDWFGPTSGNGYMLVMNQDDNSQWVVYNNIKQYIPSTDILQAWGFGDPIPVSGSFIAGIPTGPWLGRLAHAPGSPALYFVDGGKKYYVPSSQMKDAFGFTGQVESYVSGDLFDLPKDSGWLSYAVKNASSPSLYMVDGRNGSNQVVLRQYANPNVFATWEGDNGYYTTLSDTYFNQIDNAIGSNLTGYTIKGDGPDQYQVVAGQKLYLSGGMSAVYNQTHQTVTQYTINRLVSSSPVTNFIRLPGNGVTIYMVDQGQKLPVSSPDVLRAWSPGGNIQVNVLNQGFLNLLTTGTAVSGFEAQSGGSLYLMDQKKYLVSGSLDNAYRTGPITNASSALLNLYTTADATGFIKGSGPSVYLLDGGTKRHVPSIETFQLWNGSRNEAVTQVAEPVLSQFATGSVLSPYFSVSGTNYLMDNGTYYTVSGGVAADWNLSGPSAVTAATRDRFTAGSALKSNVKVGGTYYRVKYGTRHATTNENIANIWGLTDAPLNVTANAVNLLGHGPDLGIYARSSDAGDTRIFIADNNATTFYHVTSVEQLQNFGVASTVPVPAASLGSATTVNNILKTSTSGTERLIDTAKKRNFASDTVKGRWVTGPNVTTVSSSLYNYFSDGGTVAGNIKGSAPNVYNMDNGQKRWIQSQSSYQSNMALYGAFSTVSDWLISILPTGSNIP